MAEQKKAPNPQFRKCAEFIKVQSEGARDCAIWNGTSLDGVKEEICIFDSSDAEAEEAEAEEAEAEEAEAEEAEAEEAEVEEAEVEEAAALLAAPLLAPPTEAQPPGQPVRPPRRHVGCRSRSLPPSEMVPIEDDQQYHIPFPFVDGQYGHQNASAMSRATDANTEKMLQGVTAMPVLQLSEVQGALNDTPGATFVAWFQEWRIREGVVKCQFYGDECHAGTWARYYKHGMDTMKSAMKLLEVGWTNLKDVLRVASVRTTATEKHYHLSILIGVAAELRMTVQSITEAHGWTLKGTGRMFGNGPSLRPALTYSKKIDKDVRRVEQQLGSPPQLIVSLHQCANEKTVVTITYFEPCKYRKRRAELLTPPVEPQKVAVDQQEAGSMDVSEDAAGTSSDTTTGPVQTGARPTAMGAVKAPASKIGNRVFCPGVSEDSQCVKSSGHTTTTTHTTQAQVPTFTPRFVDGVSFNVPFHPADLILNVWWLATNAVPSTPQITSRTLFLRLLYHGDDGFALLARLLRTALLTLTSPKTQVSPSPEERLHSSRIPVQFLFNTEPPSDDVPTVVLPFDTSSLLTISCLDSAIRIAHWTYEKPSSTQ